MRAASDDKRTELVPAATVWWTSIGFRRTTRREACEGVARQGAATPLAKADARLLAVFID
jgi:hypothetical protein